jgi:F-type H+-transporting ATPase subunit a
MEIIFDYIKNLPLYFYTSLALMTVIAIVSIYTGLKVDKLDVREKPNKFMTAVISFISFFNDYVKGYIGKHWRYVAPLTLTLALYVLISNISGIIALDTPTKYTSITFSLSIVSFFIVQSTGFLSLRFKHFLGIFKPLAPMAPLNIISDVTPILSMSLRLFGNIASGALILTLIYKVTGWASIFITPFAHLLFDIAFGLVQTLVIVLLTIIFASIKIDEADLDIN